MGKKKIILDVRQVVPYKHTALIVCHRTGVHYQAQVGGLLCNQVFVQGFCIDLEDLAQDFDDCAYGCHEIQFSKALQKDLADILDHYLQEALSEEKYDVFIDYDRLDEIQEGWWPVVVTGKLSGGIIPDTMVSWKGYLHRGNCD